MKILIPKPIVVSLFVISLNKNGDVSGVVKPD